MCRCPPLDRLSSDSSSVSTSYTPGGRIPSTALMTNGYEKRHGLSSCSTCHRVGTSSDTRNMSFEFCGRAFAPSRSGTPLSRSQPTGRRVSFVWTFRPTILIEQIGGLGLGRNLDEFGSDPSPSSSFWSSESQLASSLNGSHDDHGCRRRSRQRPSRSDQRARRYRRSIYRLSHRSDRTRCQLE